MFDFETRNVMFEIEVKTWQQIDCLNQVLTINDHYFLALGCLHEFLGYRDKIGHFDKPGSRTALILHCELNKPTLTNLLHTAF